MSDLTGTLSIDISGLGGSSNPLPFELVSAEALTAASGTGLATASYTGAATDLGTVASVFTLAVSAADASFSPSMAVFPPWAVEADYGSQVNPAEVGAYSATLQGSLDGDNWYDLVTTNGALLTVDGSTIEAAPPGVANAGGTLARYLRSAVGISLTGVFYEYIYPSTWESLLVTSLAASVTAYVGVQL